MSSEKEIGDLIMEPKTDDIGSVVSKMSPAEITKEKRKIMKNIVLISMCFLFNFNAFNGLARLQSSLHIIEGMGTVTQSVLYGALVISCLFLPRILISQLGHKWTIPVCFTGYILWMAANGYAVWGTMVTASIIVGLCAAPLWTAQCAYFTKEAGRYSKLSGEDQTAVITRFFGIFFLFFQLSTVIGSIISYTVLRGDLSNATTSDPKFCGVNDCPWTSDNSTEAYRPSSDTVWTMVGIYIGVAVAAVIIVSAAVNRLPVYLREPKVTGKELAQHVVATAKQVRLRNQCLLIPLTMYSGFEQAFFNAEFSRSFISCPIGLWNVGLVTLPFGIINAAVSYGSGHLAKYTGRLPIFITGMVVDLCLQFTMMFWLPDPDKRYVLFILSGMYGFTDGIWQTQINALYGSIFSDNSEAAFSNYRMWESLGFIIAFAYSNFLCTSAKLYILTCMLVVGIACYLVVEITEMKKNKVQENIQVAPVDPGQKPPPYSVTDGKGQSSVANDEPMEMNTQ